MALSPVGLARKIDPLILEHAGDHREQQNRHAPRHQPIYFDTSDTIEHRPHYSFQIWSPASTRPGLYLVFTKRWSLYEQFTKPRPPFPYDRCSSTNHSRGEHEKTSTSNHPGCDGRRRVAAANAENVWPTVRRTKGV